MDIQSGGMQLRYHGSHGGEFRVAGGTSLDFAGGTARLDGSYLNCASGGLVKYSGGGVYFDLSITAAVSASNRVDGTPNLYGAIDLPNFVLAAGDFGGVFTNAGTMNWTGGTLEDGTLTVASGATLNISGSAIKHLDNSTLINDGEMLWSGTGNLYSDYNYNVISNRSGGLFHIQTDASFLKNYDCIFENEGTLRKSASTGTNTFSITLNNHGLMDIQSGTIRRTGNLSPSGESTIRFGIGGVIPSAEHGQLTVGGTAALDGALSAFLANDFVPEVNQTFVVIDSATRTGTFANTNILGLGQHRYFLTVYDGGQVKLLTRSTPAAVPDQPTTDEDNWININVVTNDFDEDGDAFWISSFSQPSHGVVSSNGVGILTYTPGTNYHGGDTFTYTLSDVGGGSDTGTVTVTVLPVNDAPVLTAANPSMAAISEDDVANAGMAISAIVATTIDDVDDAAVEGIAVFDANCGNGSWEYATDAGGSWQPVGSVGTANALLLRASDRMRFVPDAENADSASFAYYAWDQTSGTAGGKTNASMRGGTTCFSQDGDTATITVTAINDAPVVVPQSPIMAAITEDEIDNDGMLIVAIVGATITDCDSNAVEGVAISSCVSGNGQWQFSTNGASSWQEFGTVSTSFALLLGAGDRLRFVPDGSNADSGSVSYYAWDRTTGSVGAHADASIRGGATAFSVQGDVASITVSAVNDPPILNLPISDRFVIEGVHLGFAFPSNTFQDVDIGDRLTYAADLTDGSPLPPWLSFTGETRRFDGTPGSGAAGELSLRVTATDSAFASTSDTFSITVDPALEIVGIDQTNSAFLVQWQGGGSFTQYVDCTESLLGIPSWQCVATNPPPGSGTTSTLVPASMRSRAFIRIRVHMADE